MAHEDVLMPMVGQILTVDVKEGDKVEEGDTMATFESMKMKMPLAAPVSGTVVKVNGKTGENMEADDVFAVIDED